MGGVVYGKLPAAFLSGGCFFFAMTLRERGATLLVDYMDELRQSFREN